MPQEIRGRHRQISALVPGLSRDLLVNTVNTCKQLQRLNTSRPLKTPPPPIAKHQELQHSGSHRFSLRLKFRSDCLKTPWVPIFFSSSGLSALRLILICYWFQLGPAGEPANPVPSPALESWGVERFWYYLLKIALLTRSHCGVTRSATVHLKIDPQPMEMKTRRRPRIPRKHGWKVWFQSRWARLMCCGAAADSAADGNSKRHPEEQKKKMVFQDHQSDLVLIWLQITCQGQRVRKRSSGVLMWW